MNCELVKNCAESRDKGSKEGEKKRDKGEAEAVIKKQDRPLIDSTW